MRLVLALPLLALAACNVTTDDKNDQMTIQYNEALAENTLDTATDKAGQIAGQIANDVQETGETIERKTENVDVDVDVRTDGEAANANAN